MISWLIETTAIETNSNSNNNTIETMLPSIDGHAIQIHSTGEPLEQPQLQQIPHKQNL